MYDSVIMYILDRRRPPQKRIANLRDHRGFDKVNLPRVVVYGTRCELNPDRGGIRISHQVRLTHEIALRVKPLRGYEL